MAIQPINPIPALSQVGATQKAASSSNTQQVGQTFENMLTALNQSQLDTDALVQNMAQGGNVDLHTVMIGLEENNVNFNVALGIRDKLVEAYREIMRMQV